MPAATAGSSAVGQGSEAPPRLLRLAHRHPDATQHLALIGKGITFDTGGISIKPAAGMEAMKNDMGGAAAVIAATIAIARLGLAVNVTTYAPMAENMPSGSATRPSDVFVAYGGKTVEVLNTDAEAGVAGVAVHGHPRAHRRGAEGLVTFQLYDPFANDASGIIALGRGSVGYDWRRSRFSGARHRAAGASRRSPR